MDRTVNIPALATNTERPHLRNLSVGREAVLALGQNTFTIGAVAYIGNGTDAVYKWTNYQGFDAFTINDGRTIGEPTHDGLKVYD